MIRVTIQQFSSVEMVEPSVEMVRNRSNSLVTNKSKVVQSFNQQIEGRTCTNECFKVCQRSILRFRGRFRVQMGRSEENELGGLIWDFPVSFPAPF